MNIFVRKYADCLREAFVNVGTIELGSYYDRAITKLQNEVVFPGYRKGKVPPEVIEKNKGNDLLQTVFSLIVQDAAQEMGTQGIKFYSEPNINPITGLSRHSRFVFTLTFEVYPEIISDIKLEEFNVPFEQYAIDDKMIDYYMKTQISTMKDADGKIQEKDVITGNILNKDFMDDDKEIVIEVAEIPMLIGHKKGDQIDLPFDQLGNYVIRFLGQINDPLQVEITKIERKQVDNLTDDIVKESTSYQSLAEFKEKTAKGLEDMAQHLNQSAKRKALAEYIRNTIEMEIPKSFFLEKAKYEAYKFLNDMNIADPSLKEMIQDESIRTHMPIDILDQSLNEIAFLIVIDKVIQQNSIEASDSLVNSIAQEHAKENKMSLDEFKNKSTNDEWENVKREAQRETAIGFILDKVKFSAKSEVPLIKIK